MLPNTIPTKLPGTVIAQYVRCGKAECKCARGELYGPYWYRFWRDDGFTLRKEYVRKADLEAVREGRALIHTGRALVRRIARCDASERGEVHRVVGMLAGAYLLEKLDDYFLVGKGTWRQQLGVLYIQDDLYTLATEPSDRVRLNSIQSRRSASPSSVSRSAPAC